jgi:Protein of unknown function (DUF2889)
MTLALAPRETANPAPVRPPLSVRRTSSIDVEWTDGPQGDRVLHGRVRDFATDATGGPGILRGEAAMEARLAPDKTITAISADPAPATLQQLVGQRGGNHLRLMIRETMPELLAQAAPLYLVLDDISGTALVCTWAWSQWNPDWMASLRQTSPEGQVDRMLSERAGVCWGLKPGNSGLDPDRQLGDIGTADGGELRNPADPDGWHPFPVIAGVSMRRARRIDVIRDDEAGLIRIDAAFQDSAPRRQGGRAALHEYRLAATIDASNLKFLTITPEPRVLPFPECPGAVHNTQRLIGTSLTDVRASVLAQLRGPEGCTHLNDALRALAEVPQLVSYLDR